MYAPVVKPETKHLTRMEEPVLMFRKLRKILLGIVSGRLNTSFTRKRVAKHASKIEKRIGKTPMLLAPLTAGWLCYLIAIGFPSPQDEKDPFLLFLLIYTFEMSLLLIGSAVSDSATADGEPSMNPFPGFFIIYVITFCIRWLFLAAFIFGIFLGLLAVVAKYLLGL